MKIRNGFVSNSSSSSFIVQLKKPIEQISFVEFKSYLNLENLNNPYPYCEDKEKGALQLYHAILSAKLTDHPKYKAPNAYMLDLGDLCNMEDVEVAYSLMQDYPNNHTKGFSNIKLANENIAIIDLECTL